MSVDYDVVVVGAGVEGSATAYHLIKEEQRTLLLDQFPLPHNRGSSHGHSRITRKAYKDDFYVHMMNEAYRLWAELERETGTTLYKKTGLLTIGPRDHISLAQVEKAMGNVGVFHERLSSSKLKQKYPMMRYPDNYEAVYDGIAGVLWSDKALICLQNVFTRLGGEIRSEEKMINVIPGDIVTVRTTKGVYRARSVVITAGPWMPQLLKPLGLNLPLQSQKTTFHYWKEKVEGVHAPENGFPCFVDQSIPDQKYIYGFPSGEYPGLVKIAIHSGAPVGPDRRDSVQGPADLAQATSQYLRNHLPGLDGACPAITETCMYTVTPDYHFVLDAHPRWKNIIIGAGFSGHGFKLAPVVGKILSELATGKPSTYDLSHFTVRRFSQKSSL